MILNGKLIDENTWRYATECLICGESILLTDNEVAQMKYGHPLREKICNRCREAVLFIRKSVQE